MEQDKKRRIYGYGLSIILGTILLLGISYAWLSLTLTGTKTNVLKSGTLSLTLDDKMGEEIRVDSAFPMYDAMGMQQTPYRFTLTNNGTVDSNYTIYLDDMDLLAGETRAVDNTFKYGLNKNGRTIMIKSLANTGSNPNRILDSGRIMAGETIECELRLWVDENVTNALSGQKFLGKLRVEATQVVGEYIPDECFVLDTTGTIIEQYICGPTIPSGYSSSIENTNEINDITDAVIPNMINGKKIIQIGYPTEELNAMCSTGTFGEQQECQNKKKAFSRTGVQYITIPEGVEVIGSDAFSKNNFTNITIPSSVTSIGTYAFWYNALTSVTIKGKSSTTDFVSYPTSSPFDWASGYNDSNIIWNR